MCAEPIFFRCCSVLRLTRLGRWSRPRVRPGRLICWKLATTNLSAYALRAKPFKVAVCPPAHWSEAFAGATPLGAVFIKVDLVVDHRCSRFGQKAWIKAAPGWRCSRYSLNGASSIPSVRRTFRRVPAPWHSRLRGVTAKPGPDHPTLHPTEDKRDRLASADLPGKAIFDNSPEASCLSKPRGHRSGYARFGSSFHSLDSPLKFRELLRQIYLLFLDIYKDNCS